MVFKSKRTERSSINPNYNSNINLVRNRVPNCITNTNLIHTRRRREANFKEEEEEEIKEEEEKKKRKNNNIIIMFLQIEFLALFGVGHGPSWRSFVKKKEYVYHIPKVYQR